jgi:hypothetical protein
VVHCRLTTILNNTARLPIADKLVHHVIILARITFEIWVIWSNLRSREQSKGSRPKVAASGGNVSVDTEMVETTTRPSPEAPGSCRTLLYGVRMKLFVLFLVMSLPQ